MVTALTALGYMAVRSDFLELTISEKVDVISMADVLEHMPYPRIALAKVWMGCMVGVYLRSADSDYAL